MGEAVIFCFIFNEEQQQAYDDYCENNKKSTDLHRIFHNVVPFYSVTYLPCEVLLMPPMAFEYKWTSHLISQDRGVNWNIYDNLDEFITGNMHEKKSMENRNDIINIRIIYLQMLEQGTLEEAKKVPVPSTLRLQFH